MRRKSNKIRNLAIYGVIGVIAYALIFQGGLPFADAGTFEIKIPPPDYDSSITNNMFFNDNYSGYESAPLLRTVGDGSRGTVSSSGFVTCTVSQDVYPKDNQSADYSKKYSSNDYRSTALPLTLIESGDSFSSILSHTKIKCDDKNGELRIKSANIQTDATAKSKDGRSTIQIGSSKSSASDRSITEDYNQVIGTGYFLQYQMEQQLKNQVGSLDYTTQFTFKPSGTIQIYYADNPSKIYTFKISSSSIPVSFPVTVKIATQLDSDNDGVLDQFDKCKTQPETINGYYDNDGCPDSLPKTTPTDPDDNNSPQTVPPVPQPTICSQPDVIVNGVCTPPQDDPTDEIEGATIVYHIRLSYTDGTYSEWKDITGGTFELQSLSLATKLTEDGSSKPISALIYQPYLLIDDGEKYEIYQNNLLGKAKINFMGSEYELGDSTSINWRTNSATYLQFQNDIKGYGVNLGQYKFAIQQIDSLISGEVSGVAQLAPTDLIIYPAFHGDVKLRLGQSTYSVTIVDNAPNFNFKYSKGSDAERYFTCPNPNETYPNCSTSTGTGTGTSTGTGTGTSTGTGTGTSTGTGTGTSTGGKTTGSTSGGCWDCEEAPTVSKGDILTSGNICVDLTVEQCATKLSSDPIQLTFILIAIVIFIGLIGGLVMRGRTNYGSGYQIPRPY